MIRLNDGRHELWQWDRGRSVSAEGCTQVHFSVRRVGRSLDVDVVNGSADIPDVLLQAAGVLLVWGYVGSNEDGYTRISKEFRIRQRNRPADYVYTPEDQIALAEVVEIARRLREDAEAGVFDGAPGKSAYQSYLDSGGTLSEEAWAMPMVDINLPEKYDLVVCRPFELFYRGILGVRDVKNVNIVTTCNMGQAMERKYYVLPTAAQVGEHTLTITVYDDFGSVIATGSTILNVEAEIEMSPSSPMNVLCIGDSLTHYGQWVDEVYRMLAKKQASNYTPEFDELNWSEGGVTVQDAVFGNGTSAWHTDYIPINGYEQIAYKGASSNNYLAVIAFYNADKIMLSGGEGIGYISGSTDYTDDTEYTADIPEGAFYCRLTARAVQYNNKSTYLILKSSSNGEKRPAWCLDSAPESLGLENIRFIGKKTTPHNEAGYEGYGGWRYDSYLTTSDAGSYCSIDINQSGKTVADVGAVYSDANGLVWEIIAVDNIRVFLKKQSGVGKMPVTGSLTWVSGGVSTTDIPFDTADKSLQVGDIPKSNDHPRDYANPFCYAVNGENKVDFGAYLDDLGVDGSVDLCYILLGGNSWSAWANRDNGAWAVYKADVKAFIDQLLAFNPSCKVVLGNSLQIPHVTGLGIDYGAHCFWNLRTVQSFVFATNRLYEEIAAEYAEAGYDVEHINIQGQFDSEFGFPAKQQAANSRVKTSTSPYYIDGYSEEHVSSGGAIHPNNYGYMQIADAMFRHFNNAYNG